MWRRSGAATGGMMGLLLLAGCGGSPGAGSPVARVCGRAFAAARQVLGPSAAGHVTGRDRADIECQVRGRGLVADVESQASALAWEQFDTVSVHLAQAFGSGGVHDPSHLPHPLSGVAPQAIWVPAQGQLIAESGGQSRGGTYLTVSVTGRGADGAAGLGLARAIARAVVPVAPRGPSSGPPPN